MKNKYSIFSLIKNAFSYHENWQKAWKDPQKKQVDFVDWVELIKFRETRNYVQRVLENYNVYRYILEKKPIIMKDFFKDQPLY